MADPGTLLTIASLAMTAVKAVGELSQASSQASAQDHNAAAYDRDAQQALLNSAEEERRTRRDNALRLGSMGAKRGASGVAIEGSPLLVAADEGASAELRALDARYGGLMQARALQQQAAITRQQASATRRGAAFGAVGTLVGGGLQYGQGLLGGAPLGAGRTGYTAGILEPRTGRLVGGV